MSTHLSHLHPKVLEQLIILRDIMSDSEEIGADHLIPTLVKLTNKAHQVLQDEHSYRLGSMPQRVLLVGEAGAGKSSLLNALMESGILLAHEHHSRELTTENVKKVGLIKRLFNWFKRGNKGSHSKQTTMTSCCVHLSYSSTLKAELHLKNDEIQVISGEHFVTWENFGTSVLNQARTLSNQLKHVKLYVPDPNLIELEIIDTPSLSNADVTIQNLMTDCALPIIIMRANEPLDLKKIERLLVLRRKIYTLNPLVVITHAEQVSEEKLSDLKNNLHSLKAKVSVLDLRPLIKDDPYKRGLNWREELGALVQSIQARETPFECSKTALENGSVLLSYRVNENTKNILIPPKGQEPLSDLLNHLKLARSKRQEISEIDSKILVNEFQSTLALEIKTLQSKYNQITKSQKTTDGTKVYDVIMSVLKLVPQSIFKKIIEESLHIRNLTSDEKHFYFTPYAGLVIDGFKYSWDQKKNKILFNFQMQIEKKLKESKIHLGDAAFDQDLFIKFFNEINQNIYDCVWDEEFQAWYDANHLILLWWENLTDANTYAPHERQAITEQMQQRLMGSITAPLHDMAHAYVAALEGKQLELIEKTKIRVTQVQEKLSEVLHLCESDNHSS